MQSLIVKDYMETRIVTFKKSLPLSAALDRVLQSEHLGGPVVDDHNEVIGFISEKDMLEKLLKVSYQCQDTHTVEECMHKEPLTVTPNTSIVDLASMMLEDKPKVYPVVEGKTLVGIINRRDVLKAIQAQLNLCYQHPI